jgi:hypothetical protein
MEFSELVDLVKDQPLFDTGQLLSGKVDPAYIRKQLSLWLGTGKIIQLRRGLYSLTSPYQKVRIHPFILANCLYSPSYVSYQSALSHYGLIPEGVYAIVSATTRKTKKWKTQLGSFSYHSMQKEWFSGYTSIKLDDQQSAFIARPEKALLDLVLLTPRGDSPAFLDELRLQNLDIIDLSGMQALVNQADKPNKLNRFFIYFQQLVQQQARGNRRL